MDLLQKCRLAEDTARKAGEMLLKREAFAVRAKALHDFVTEMDVRSENLIRESLLSACPEDGFFGEEGGGDEARDGRWIVDPIDGTTNYIRDIPGYTVSIAYEKGGELVLGVVYCPRLDEMYTAIRGMGAFRNGEKLSVSSVSAPEDAIVNISFCHRNYDNNRRMLEVIDRLHLVNDMRRTGSAAYDLCCVACGRSDAFLELGLHLYDIAAGLVIVREAGGEVEQWPGSAPVEISCDVFAHNKKVDSWLRELL
ncbi:MAG: inositol monophosphatase family protein [Christensenellales bacterium]|jgi:myo-inositol-1(or 4)-monophosphatase